MSSNDRVGVSVTQPKKSSDRFAVAKHCCNSLEITMPMVVDEMDDRVGHAYSGMPDRLYVIDREGRVAYKGGRGPFAFKPGEMEQALVMTLLDQATAVAQAERVPMLSTEQAWKKMPAPEQGAGQALPAWAQALAGPLPRTTAGMLELDYLQRTHSPLDPKLRGKMRWVAAHANHCAYGEAYATADLRRAGLDEAGIKSLAGDWANLPEAERAALSFARKLTLAAYSVSDAEMARLVDWYGDRQVVAMVLLLAYANFQDRLLLTLGLDVEPNGPLPPLEIRFAKKPGVSVAAAERPGPDRSRGIPASPARVQDTDWLSLDFKNLQQQLDQQRARPTRIRVPAWEDVKKGLPSWYPASRPSRIQWSLVCLGYQPELSAAWLYTMRTFGQEAQQDRVFEESLFWIVTRTLQCFY
jgi:alkylhydroperoxidase family enzyme